MDGGRGPAYLHGMRSLAAALICLWPAAAPAQTARLEVTVEDAAMLDVVVLRNVEACGPVSGMLRIDFGPSAGQVVIDTEHGGRGTQDPRTPVVRTGPGRLMEVEDGAQVLDLLVAGLAPGAEVVVTFDIDSEAEPTRAGRIVA
ncbi:MAG: hypothetical protein ACOCY0_05135, partial [Roseicyclus sp.]